MPDADGLSSLWQEAVKKYEKMHGCTLSLDAAITPDNVFNDARFQFETFHAKNKKLISVFKPFYETVQAVAQVVGHGIKHVYPPAESIIAAVLFLIDVTFRTLPLCNANLLGLPGCSEDQPQLRCHCRHAGRVAVSLRRVRMYCDAGIPPEIEEMVVESLVQSLHIIGLSTKTVQDGHSKVFLKTLIHKDKKIQEALQKLDRLSTQENLTVNASVLSTTSEMFKAVKYGIEFNRDHSQVSQLVLMKISDTTLQLCNLEGRTKYNTSLLEELKAITAPIAEATRKQQLQKLKPSVAFSVEHEPCYPGTRPDILQDIYDWAADREAPNIFWLYGHPGTGKSTIATTVRHTFARDRRLGAACFFRREDVVSHSPKAVWRSIAHDLADKHGFLTPSIITKLEQNLVDVEDSSAFDVFKVLILDTLEQSADGFNDFLVIIVDALDEFGGLDPLNQPQRDLLQTLAPNWKKLPSCFKLLITSRDQGYIANYLYTDSSECVALKVGEAATAQSSTDIRIFLTAKFADISSRPPRVSRSTWSVSEADITDLVKAAAGLFIWASTVVKMVAKRPTVLRHILAQVRGGVGSGSALDGLGQLYQNILEWAYDDFGDDELFQRLVGAVINGRIPLSCESLAMLLDVEFDDVVAIVGKLQPVLDSSSSTLHFIHKSFVDYVIGAGCPERFRCDIRTQDERMALACFLTMSRELHYNMGSMKSSHHLNRDYPEMSALITDHLAYGCRFWASHIPNSSLGAALKKAVEMFMNHHLLFWLEVLSILDCFGVASTSMTMLVSRLDGTGDFSRMRARDALFFIRTLAPAMSQSYPHIYLSALAFTPTSSAIRHQYIASFPGLLHVSRGLNAWQRQLGVLRGHEHIVTSVVFSPDGTRIVSGSFDCTIRLWDATTHHHIGEPFRGHPEGVTSVAFSPDGSLIVSGSKDSTIRLWDAETHELIGEPLIGHKEWVNSVAFSPDGVQIVSGSRDRTIRLWDAKTHELIGEPLEGHEDFVTSVAFSPDGTRIVSGSCDNTICLWNAATYRLIGTPLKGHSDAVDSVAFSPDGTRIVSGSDDSSIRIWDVETHEPVGRPLKGHESRVSSIAFSPDGTRIASCSTDTNIRLWDAETQEPIGKPLQGHITEVNAIYFSPDGTWIASCCSDSTIHLWDAESQEPSGEPLGGHEFHVSSVDFSPDGSRIVSGSYDNTIRLWDAKTYEPIGEPFRGHETWVDSVAFSSDGTRIVSGSRDSTIRLWDAETQQPIGEPLKDPKTWVTSVAFSPDGAWIVSSSREGTIRLWDAETQQPIGEPLQDRQNFANSVAFSPDGTRIISGSKDNNIRLWDAKTRKSIGEPLQGHEKWVNSVAFSPDGTRIVSGSSDSTIRLWNAATYEPIGDLFRGQQSGIISVVFSPDGARIVSGSVDFTICLWDTETHLPFGEPFRGHQSVVTSVAFSPDGTRLVSSSYDHTVRLWDATIYNDMTHTNTTTSTLKALIPAAGLAQSSPPLSLLHDGWVIGPSGERLFWIPQSLHISVQTVGLLAILGRSMTTFDFSQFVHGESWMKCYVPPTK